MTEVKTSRGPLRYRIYYRLMDLSLIGIFALLLNGIASTGFGLSMEHWPSPFNGIAGTFLVVTAAIIPLFLVIARWMRDDYAEGLWKRTATVMAYATALVPLAVILVAWGTYWWSVSSTGNDEFYKAVFGPIFDPQRGNTVLTAFWNLFLMFFVVIFQFLRWKDSR